MTMTITQQIITVVVVVLGTMTTRFFALYHISGRKGTAGCDHLSGKSAALCSDRIAGGILSEGCAGKYLLLTARADRNTVHCGIT